MTRSRSLAPGAGELLKGAGHPSGRQGRPQRGHSRCFVRTQPWRLAAWLIVVTPLAADVRVPFLRSTVLAPAWAVPNDSRIFTIEPACAGPGDVVTLTGNGFGAENVVIQVGGVVASLVSAYGNRVTFIVPGGASEGVTTVTATNPGEHVGGITFRVRGEEICGNDTDEDCDGVVNDPDACAPLNHPPVARAGDDQAAPVGATVQLDGTASSDLDGDLLLYQWTLTSKPVGSATTVHEATAATPTLLLDVAGDYTLTLQVSDGILTDTDTVVISTGNSAPVANAGPDQTVRLQTLVTLDGTQSSDADGDRLTYQWTMLSVPVDSATMLSDSTSPLPTIGIDKPGAYTVQLIVHDGTVASASDTVTLSTVNSPPVADAGLDQTRLEGETVTLDGSGSSDVDGNLLTYQWSLLSLPSGSTATLSTLTSVTPSLTLDKGGTYVVQLIVNDGIASSAPDTVAISTVNSPPVADAGPDQTVTAETTVSLDGSRSFDVDRDRLTFVWSLVSVPAESTATLTDPTSVTPTFTLDRTGQYIAQLIVHDGTVDSAPDTVTISTVNSRPVAEAGVNQNQPVGAVVTLDGGGSTDVDGDVLVYFWALTSKPAGSAAMLSDPAAVGPTFTVDLPGQYVVQLIVSDGTVDSAPDTVMITVPDTIPPPPADLGKLIVSPVTNGQVTLTGTAGSVEGDAQVTVTNTSTQESRTVTANLDGGFSVAISAAWGDWLLIVARDAVGNTSLGRLLAIEAPLSVVMTEPQPDAVVSMTTIQVRGQVQGPANTGVTVNGVPAFILNGEFIADAVPLALGTNTLTVTATTQFGQTLTQSLVVTRDGAPPALALEAVPQSGVVPLEVTLRYTFNAATAIQSLSMDFDGDGTTDLITTNSQEVLHHTYTTPGMYLARLRLTDAQSVEHAAETVVVVYDEAIMDALFTRLWSDLNLALMVGDVSTALTFLTAGARVKYEPVFTILLPHMPEIIASYSPLQRVSLSGDIGEYAIMRVIDGQLRLFLVYFLQDSHGVWRLEAM